ncbi:MAG: tetratricopeptide repeat protein [Saprospiraceae bacterium]|nr:tetratricopeptide repeat protein [Saprospiraceae bacterium]MCF8249284.1 tetratricopeptide repeat protein [Saprospiraceae bacterium]MCF8279705.1 tetratricopeptide repeat protein [Bacteroidales bacterium]MCF8311439.1 tetratricopeptide repeat protein [Saprospiraceae bacterium]MCF8439903.1 tetratricopeptide repeat protein [Saprospiraceae bacterium]
MRFALTILFLLMVAHLMLGQGNELALAKKYEVIADSLSQIPNNSKAILYRKKALNIYQNQRPVPFEKIASTYRAIGIYYRRDGKFNDGEFNLKRAVEVAEKHLYPTHPEIARTYNSYGIYLLTIGKYESALGFLNKSLAINRSLDLPGVADNLNNIGIIHENLGDYTAAFEHYKQALNYNRYRQGLFTVATANNYINLGTACLRLDRYEEAKSYFDTALLIYDKKLVANHPEFAALYNNLGAVANWRGDYRTAIENFEKALKISEKNLGENHPDVANIYANTGILLLNRGDITKALAFFKKAYDIRIRFFGQKNHLVARTCNYLGDCYLQKKDNDSAYEWYNKAILIFEGLPIGDPSDFAEYKNDLGYYFEKMGNFQSALQYYNEALNVVRKQPGKQDLDVANSIARIGNLLLSKSSFKEARQHFLQALGITKRFLGDKHPDVAQIYGKLALSSVNDARLSLAYCDSAMMAINYTKANSFNFETVSSPLALLDILEKKGKLLQSFYVQQKQRKWLDDADTTYATGMQLIDFVKITLEEPGSRQALLDNYFLIYENAIAVKCELKNLSSDKRFWHEAFEISERSNATLLLEALQSVHAGRFSEIPDSLLSEEYASKIDLAFLEKQVFEEQLKGADANQQKLLEMNSHIFSLQQKYARLMDGLRRDYPRYFKLKYAPEVVTVPEIQKKLLRPSENMVGYFVGEENIFAFVISEDKFEVVTIPKEFPLESWVEEFRNSIFQYNPASKDVEYLSQKYVNLGYELYELLFQPIRSHLTGNQVVILPGGVLGYLPFDALLATPPDEYGSFDTHDYLIKQYQFSYSYSATLHKEMVGRNVGWRKGGFVGFAPSYGGDSLNLRRNDPWRAVLGNLKFNKPEVVNIQQIMGGKIYLDSAATEQNFMRFAPDAGILHLAVHAKSNDEHGEYSYLAFFQTIDSVENELVFVKDLYSMRINAALVVLSACETGIGELQRGEGIVSLARGFSYAGAASIVTTLWSVDDFASSEIMEFFYLNLKAGNSKDEALRQAKLTFLNKKKGSNASHPLYWAAFIPVGDMTPIKENQLLFWVVGGIAGLGLLLGFQIFRRKKRRLKASSTFSF